MVFRQKEIQIRNLKKMQQINFNSNFFFANKTLQNIFYNCVNLVCETN